MPGEAESFNVTITDSAPEATSRLLEGDHYCEPADVVRGVFEPPSAADLVTAIAPCAESFALDDDMKNDTLDLGLFAESSQELSQSDVASDPPEHLESTHVMFASQHRPAELLNYLLKFFHRQRSDLAVEIVKVNRIKLSIKAHAFLNYVSTMIKVRIYQQKSPSQKFVIEFQRRSGDIVAFHKLHTYAATLLMNLPREQTCMQNCETSNLSWCVAMPERYDILEHTCLEPWLEIATFTQDLMLLQEAASHLANLAATTLSPNNQAAATLFAQLISPRGLGAIYKLLERDQFSIAYPTAYLLVVMAKHPETQLFLATHGVLLAVLEKMYASASGGRVWLQLALAVNSAVSSCASDLPIEIVEKLASSIHKVNRDGEFEEATQALSRIMDSQRQMVCH